MFALTYKGNQVSLIDPQPDQFDLDDIANALSHTCRWAGNTNQHYSVAQHSILVSELVAPEYALLGLVHDFTEAFMGDCISPIKQMFPEIKILENKLEEVIFQKFGIEVTEEAHRAVKRADLIARATEHRDLFAKGSAIPPGIIGIPPDVRRIKPMTMPAAKKALMDRFYALTQKEVAA